MFMNLSDMHVQITCEWRAASVAIVADGIMGGDGETSETWRKLSLSCIMARPV